MEAIYDLIRPIFGFWGDIGQVVTIPAGARVKPIILKNGQGLCTALWDGRAFMAFHEDIERNGIAAGPGGPHPEE